jgi:hypothetical protein
LTRRRKFVEDLDQLAALLKNLGCPAERAGEMAAQLEKRAGQLSATTGRTHEEALSHLLNLMKQGWAAKEKGF